LLQIVPALCSTGCLAGLLHRGQQQGNQDRDNRDHDKQFDERKTSPTHEPDSRMSA
jgi:hypothetical protein